jgi:hypothetical protein
MSSGALPGTGYSYNGVYGVKSAVQNRRKRFILLEHRMGFEPMNTGFAVRNTYVFSIT